MSTEEKTTIMPKELQRRLARQTFWGTIIAAIIGAIAAITSAYIAITPRLPAREQDYDTQVLANAFPFDSTNVTVEQGDEIWIIVQGEDANWNCGWGSVSADGHFGHKGPEFYSPSADFCELIGYIQQDSVLFRVGTYEHFFASRSGLLYLGANDDPTTRDNNRTYYEDNSGKLSVEIIIRRK